MGNLINFLANHLMIPILQFFYQITFSYGWSIIFLTLTIKIALMPLTIKQFNSMKGMQKLQPKMKELQQRYKGKPEELNKKMMAFYKEHKVNPLGGCLPILFQMPFLIALYGTLIGDKFKTLLMVSGSSSFFLISDLAKSGVFTPNGLHIDNLVLVILFGVTTFISQKIMTANPNDPMQRQMSFMMPIMITFMFFMFPIPSGVFIYMVVSNFITIGQYFFMKSQDSGTPASIMISDINKKEAKVSSENYPEDKKHVKENKHVNAIGNLPSSGKSRKKKKKKRKR